MSLRNLTVATTLAALTAVGGFSFSPAAHAGNVKDCGTTTAPVTPPNGNAGFTQTTTTTQTSACNSSSDTGQTTTTTPTTNKGGGTPKGH
jgi:hypothetical protein